MRSRLASLWIIGLLVVGAALLVGCGGEEERPVRTAENGAEINDADVAFATGLLQHAAEGLLILDLTVERDLTPDTSAMVEEVRTALLADVEQATTWLEAWGEDVPETARDHANAGHGHDDEAVEESGEYDDLLTAQGTAFDEALAARLSAHHEGTVTLTRVVRAEGHESDVLAYAADLEEAAHDWLEPGYP